MKKLFLILLFIPLFSISQDDSNKKNGLQNLLKQAEKLQLKTVSGVGMLINQAVPGFEHWFQKTPVIDDDVRRFIVD